jgi:hypothetical protein
MGCLAITVRVLDDDDVFYLFLQKQKRFVPFSEFRGP